MEKFCQCCGMLLNDNNLGTEKDGTKVYHYCNLCYLGGEHIKKSVSYNEFFDIDIKEIEKFRVSKFKSWILKKYYLMQFKRIKNIKRSNY